MTLALSGGGARCFAHLGVIAALHEAGLEPVAASATSLSAFMAALWAAGHTPEEAFSIMIDALPAMLRDWELQKGLLGQEGFGDALAPWLPERFEQLRRPIAVVAVNATNGERLVLDSGPLVPALLASNAFPMLFVPARLGALTLVDGGAVEMLPVRSAMERWDAPVLAVDASPPLDYDLPLDAGSLPAPLGPLVTAMVTPFALAWKSYLVTQTTLVECQLQAHPPRWLLRLELPEGLGLFRVDRASEAYEAGLTAARDLLRDLERKSAL